MRWENLTVPNFVKAVKKSEGVGIIPIGVLEPHASHLPLGTDVFEAHWVACRAAEQEPAVVFPQYPWGINHESGHLPGSIVMKRELVFAVIENVCDEMGRHGLSKIVLLSGHGGNRHFIPLFIQTLTEKRKPYCVYFARVGHHKGGKELLETTETGHACEAETSVGLHIFPELVKMDDVPDEAYTSDGKLKDVQKAGCYTTADWYSMYPTMYVGDASKATAEKGKVFTEGRVTGLVEILKAVKKDDVTAKLVDTFMDGQDKPKSAY